MAHKLPPLPFSYDALEPYVDTLTMQLHHTKHHQTYVNNLNAALEKFPELASLGIDEINHKVGTEGFPQEITTAVRNNGGGHWNHSLFWTLMCNPSSTGGPGAAPQLKRALESEFGSVDAFKEKFNAAAAGVFGSGWAWLVVTPEGRLAVTSTANQDNPLQQAIVVQPGTPVLGLDVWEHAYYLHYQNRRPEYINAWWNVVSWEEAEQLFTSKKHA